MPIEMERMKRHLLLVGCPDRTGLVHLITGALYNQGLNIVRNGEFVDRVNGRFYMRTEFEGACDYEQVRSELAQTLALEDGVSWMSFHPPRPKDVVLLATKEHHCLGDLLVRHAYGDINARILAVVSNHEVLGDLVRKFALPFHFVPHADKDRETHEHEVLEVISGYQTDYLVLAKYMRILSAQFIESFPSKIVNIHHSFLPAFIGANPYKQAFERGVKTIGATAHFVTDDLDEGPIIAQQVIPVDHTHSARDMARAGRDVEKITLARALGLVFDDRVVVTGNKTIIFD